MHAMPCHGMRSKGRVEGGGWETDRIHLGPHVQSIKPFLIPVCCRGRACSCFSRGIILAAAGVAGPRMAGGHEIVWQRVM